MDIIQIIGAIIGIGLVLLVSKGGFEHSKKYYKKHKVTTGDMIALVVAVLMVLGVIVGIIYYY